MPGRMGGERTTMQNLRVMKIDPERDLLYIKGSVPGRCHPTVTSPSSAFQCLFPPNIFHLLIPTAFKIFLLLIFDHMNMNPVHLPYS